MTNIDTVNKTYKQQTPKETVHTSKTINTLLSIYKSSSTPRTILSNKSTRIEKPSEIDIHKDNENISDLSGLGDDLSIVTPDNLCIPRDNKRKKTPYTSVIRK